MLQAMDPPVLGLYRDVLALVFLSAGICRRPPWDSSPLPFSGLSGRGQMLSRVEETNEPTLRSQLGPPELEYGQPPAPPPLPSTRGVSRPLGSLQQGFGTEPPGRDTSCGTLPSPPCSPGCSMVKREPGCPEDLWPA